MWRAPVRAWWHGGTGRAWRSRRFGGQAGLKIIYSGENEGRSGYILEDGRNRNNGPMGSEELAAVNTRFKAGLEAREQGRMTMNDRFRLGRP